MHLTRILLFASAASAAQPGLPPDLASEPFFRACQSEGQNLWGINLCAPVVVVDPATGAFETSKPAPGALPPARANTSVDWGGEHWIMLLRPLPDDQAHRTSLFFHEAFHSHQDQLSLPMNRALATDLESMMARYDLRLEWRALAKALVTRGAVQRRHIADALAFRARRLSGHPKFAKAERDQMRSEGLASYTGIALSGDPVRLTLEQLKTSARKAELSRSFAYASGPAWGLLLDQIRPEWKRHLSEGSDLPDLMPIRAAKAFRAQEYGGRDILLEEKRLDRARRQRIASALSATDTHRALALPLQQLNLNFDPNDVISLPTSTIYRKITLSSAWGELTVDNAPVRLNVDMSKAYVQWPLPPSATLKLKKGWAIKSQPGGGYILVQH